MQSKQCWEHQVSVLCLGLEFGKSYKRILEYVYTVGFTIYEKHTKMSIWK